ncbi:MAG TPA: hypothetical protein VEI97_15460 [bacterium]|nr:hypothetical protein [bacterium]
MPLLEFDAHGNARPSLLKNDSWKRDADEVIQREVSKLQFNGRSVEDEDPGKWWIIWAGVILAIGAAALWYRSVLLGAN